MSIHYKSIESYLRKFVNRNSLTKILEIGAAEDSIYLASLTNSNIFRSNISASINNVMHFPANQIPFDDHFFDLVFMVATDYFIEQIDLALFEINRILKSPGQLIIFTYKKSTLKKLKLMNHRDGINSFTLHSFYYLNNHIDYGYTSPTEMVNLPNNLPESKLKKLLYNLIPKKLKIWRSPWVAFTLRKT
jgi:SAM-dependent methyltransferase